MYEQLTIDPSIYTAWALDFHTVPEPSRLKTGLNMTFYDA